LGDDASQERQYSIVIGRARKQICPPKRYIYADIVAYALSVAESIEIPEPSTHKEAISSGEVVEWTIAMTEEMESLHKSQTWELVKPSRGQKILAANGSSRRKKEFLVLSL